MSNGSGPFETLLAALILRVYSSPMNELPCPARPEMVMMLLRTAERGERVLERALEGIGLSPAKLAVSGGLGAGGGGRAVAGGGARGRRVGPGHVGGAGRSGRGGGLPVAGRSRPASQLRQV